MPSLDANVWRDQRKKIRTQLFARIMSENYDAAAKQIAELMPRTECSLFDAVLVEEITTPVSDFARHLSGWIEGAARSDVAAISIDLERGLSKPEIWNCAAYGYLDSVYPFRASSHLELLLAAEENPWQGEFDWDEGGVALDGLEGYRAADRAYRKARSPDADVASDLAQIMVGLKYHRFIGAAVVAAASKTSMWVVSQDHDSYWIPRGIFRAGPS